MPQKQSTGSSATRKVQVFGKSDIGRVRKENQDSFLISEPDDTEVLGKRGTLVVLADGMGGLEDGKLASKLAVDTISRSYYSLKGDARSVLDAAVKEANNAVYQRSTEGGGSRQMGSTVTALAFIRDRALIAQIGDSRAYRFRDGELRQLTRDHSLVCELLERGEIARDSDEYAFHKNILTRGLGLRNDVDVDLFEVLCLEPGDMFMLTSDGLHELVSEGEMISILQRHGEHLSEACSELIEVAREAGGPDNITAVLVRVPDEEIEKTVPLAVEELEIDSHSRRVGPLLPVSLFLAFAAGVILTLWIVRQELPTVSERQAAGVKLENLFGQYEDARMPEHNKNQIVARIRAILEDLGLLPKNAGEQGR